MKYLLFICFFLPLGLVAQKKISGKEFIQKVVFDQGINHSKNSFSKTIPLIEKYEFRTESHEFDFDQQEYQFRLSPSNPHKREAQKNMMRHIQEEPEWAKLKYECDLVEQAHRDWLKLYELHSVLSLEEEKRSLLSDRLEIHNIRASNLDIDIEESIKITSSISANRIKIEELINSISSIKSRNELTGFSLEFSNIIATDELILSLDKVKNSLSLDLLELDYDSISIQREMQLEKADNKQFFDFFQIRYQGPNLDPLKERLSLGVGFVIQNSGDSKLDLIELELEREKNDLRRKIESHKLERQIGLVYEEINKSFRDYISLESNLLAEEQTYEELKERITSRSDFKPELILDIRERLISNNKKLLDAELEIYELYLDFLEETGQFCQQPFQFFLD